MMNENLLRELFENNYSYDYYKVESPIEEILLNHLVKFLHKQCEVIVQYPISTISGNFRADIILRKGDKVVVVECDGEEHHTLDRDEWYDEWRDALILIQKKAQVIYRVKGTDIQNNIYKVFAIIYTYDEDLFNKEYADRIEKFEIEGNWYKKQVNNDYYSASGRVIPSMVEVKRKELQKDFDSFWYKYILYSLLYPNKNIYDLIDEMSLKYYESKELIQKINNKHPKLNLKNEKQLLTLFNKS